MDSITPVSILQIEENPENSVVAAPDGRVFINLYPLLNEYASQTIPKILQAKEQDDHTAMAYMKGFCDCLTIFGDAMEEMTMQARLERMEPDLDNPKE